MEQAIEIPVEIHGEERVYIGRIQAWQYGLRFIVDIDGIEVTMERDDAGEFRALLPDGHMEKVPDKIIVAAIIGVLENL